MAWDKNKPSGNMPLNISDDAIRENWAALEDALSKEHYFPDNDPDKQGKHTQEFIDFVRSGVENANHANEADHATNADYATNAGNADKLDNYDASPTRQANTIPVSDGLGFLNNWINQGSGSGLDADKIRGLPGDFSLSTNQHGYTKLPNGLIIQWGYEAQSNKNVSLPITYPNAGIIVLTSNANAQGNRIDNAFGYFVDNGTIFVATKASDGSIGGYPIYWLTIGW